MAQNHDNDVTSQRVAITGASGLIGSTLSTFLRDQGHRVHPLVRRPVHPDDDEIFWQPRTGEIDTDALEGVDAVIHLAGENIAGGRWSEERKDRILSSRVEGTTLLAGALASLERPPRVLLSVSGINYYGEGGATWLTEDMPSGDSFLSKVCVQWEAACDPARQAGIRVVHPRMGMVLAARGGALDRMLPIFKLGIGGKLGNGEQFMSWIALPDVVRAMVHFLSHDAIFGAVNLVSPHPVTNEEFTDILGAVLHRPTLFTVPAAALRLTLGEMADELLLTSLRASASKLLESGFEFLFPDIEGALRQVLQDPDDR